MPRVLSLPPLWTVLCNVNRVLCVLYFVLCLCTVYYVTVHCALCNCVLCTTVYCVLWTVYCVRCTVYGVVLCTLYCLVVPCVLVPSNLYFEFYVAQGLTLLAQKIEIRSGKKVWCSFIAWGRMAPHS